MHHGRAAPAARSQSGQASVSRSPSDRPQTRGPIADDGDAVPARGAHELAVERGDVPAGVEIDAGDVRQRSCCNRAVTRFESTTARATECQDPGVRRERPRLATEVTRGIEPKRVPHGYTNRPRILTA